ncbi:DUF1016 N-terminal domain-containing protein, partial [Bacteroides caecimuris]|uniref:DUF1016 N-terminal domain-containing protein n=3 Tax=Bacteroides TaxID=816 RepID=UPI003EBAF7F8
MRGLPARDTGRTQNLYNLLPVRQHGRGNTLLQGTEINADDAQFISDIKAIVYTAKQKAYQAADLFQVAANWLVGKRIIEQEQHGRERAEYGKRIIELAS